MCCLDFVFLKNPQGGWPSDLPVSYVFVLFVSYVFSSFESYYPISLNC